MCFKALTALVLMMLSCSSLADNPVPVEVVSPTQSALSEFLSLSGTLTAAQQAGLSPRTDGLVAKVLVDAGDVVRKGQLLLRLDDAMALKSLAIAEAAVKQAFTQKNEAMRQVTEAQRLQQQKHISESELNRRKAIQAEAEAAYQMAVANRDLNQETLDRHQLIAPFDGVINNKLTEAGEWVSRGKPVLELVATDSIRLDVRVPQERFAEINADTKVKVIPDAYPNKTIAGRIQAIVPVSDPNARSFLVRISLDTAELQLLPGTSASAQFILQHKHNSGLNVPRDAILRHPDGGFSVFIVQDQTAQRRQVSLGQTTLSGVTILSGLLATDKVVVRGNEVLRDGQAVSIVAPQ
jgi:RND family efflux transporter MFP subunit